MLTTNDITGDALRTKPASDAYRANYGGITKECPDCGKKTAMGTIHTCSPQIEPQPNPDWPESAEQRIDMIGLNGGDGLHYGR